MALLLVEGWDEYATDDEVVQAGWNGSTTSIVSSASPARTGRSLRLSLNGDPCTKALDATSSATVVVGFAVYIAGSTGTQDLLRLQDAGTEQINMEWAGTELTVKRGTTTLLTTSGLGLTGSTWYYVELVATINNSTGSVEIFVDGISRGSATGIDTQQTANAQITEISLIGASIIIPYFDDLYVLDNSGSNNTSRLGPIAVETVFPNADGTTNNWTPQGAGSNYVEVDDNGPGADDDTTYVSSSTASDKDLYGFAALTGSIGTIHGVAVSARVRAEDAGFRTLRTVARSSATEVESASKGLGVSYKAISHIYETDPNGGGAWTESSVNAAEFGIKIQD